MATESTLRYLKTDFQSQKDALLQRIRARWPKAWNDFLTSSFGVIIIDLVAWAMSTLAFLVNRQAAENYIPTMTLRESAVRVGALVDYQLHGPLPATVACEASLATAQSAVVTIQKNTLLRTGDNSALPFEVAQDYTIAVGDLTPRATVVRINADLAGANVLATFVSVTNGSKNVDLADTSIDLTDHCEAGQTFQVTGDTQTYTIEGIEASPGAVSSNRLVLSQAYQGTTATGVSAEVFDQRILLSQGQSITDRFVSPDSESPKYTVKCSRTPVIDGSVVVTVNGEVWTGATNLAAKAADDKVYQVKTLPSGETLIAFGDNVFGLQLPQEAVVLVDYRVGGGAEGNIALGALDTSISGIILSTSSPVQVSIKNSTATGIGGRDAETLEEARVSIPYHVRTNDRAVTQADYQTMAQSFSSPLYGSVAFARSTVRRENANLEGNLVIIYAWTTGSSGQLVNLSAPLKLALKDYMQTKAVGTDYVEVHDGTNQPVPVSMRFKVFEGFDVLSTKGLIEDTLSSFVNVLRPGDTVLYSNLVRELDEVFGVDTLDMATPTSDLTPSNSTELFTAPDSNHVYNIDRNGKGTPVDTTDDGTISLYTAQLPVFPVKSWSIRLFLGSNELTVVPSTNSGYAEVFGENISSSSETPSSSVSTFDPDAAALKFKSTVHLLTGFVRLWIKGSPGDLTMKLTPVTGYSQDRMINVYVGYTGTNTQTKRREIRAALRAWGEGLAIGGSLFGSEITGVKVSRSNVTSVVLAVDGVESVTRVALETPSNTSARLDAIDFELLRLGDIVLNSEVD